jgi:hypothetical protein
MEELRCILLGYEHSWGSEEYTAYIVTERQEIL